jgi:hypothetical protein
MGFHLAVHHGRSTGRRCLALLWALGGCYSPSLDDPSRALQDDPRVEPANFAGGSPADRDRELAAITPGGSAALPAPASTTDVGGSDDAPHAPPPTSIDPEDESTVVAEPDLIEAPMVESNALPSLCVGLGYSAELAATGGAGAPYRWTLLEAVPGLSIDELTGELFGIPETTGTLRVEVRDAEQAAGVRTFELSRKRACHVAYLSGPPGSTRLHLGDVFGQADIALPTPAAGGESVLDFEFSPDGDWLALRLRTANGDQLFLYPTAFEAAPSLDAELIPVRFECPAAPASPDSETCSVTEYAWSANSLYLAVVLEASTPERNYLSGLAVERPEEPWPALDTAVWDEVDPVPFDHRAELLWVGSAWVATIGPDANDPALETLYTAVLNESGDALEELVGSSFEVGPGPRLSLAGNGVVLSYSEPGVDIRDVIYSERGLVSGDGLDIKEPYLGWVSPSGKLLAAIDGDRRLQIFELGSAEVAAESERDACAEVITWSGRLDDRERIVCSHGPMDEPIVRVFDYFADQRRLSAPIDTPAEFSIARSRARRALSTDGDWLVMTSEAGAAALVELAQFQPRVLEFDPHLSSGAELAFAPTRSAVAFLSAKTLFELPLPLERGGMKAFSMAGAALAAPCQESYWEAPEHWCGAAQITDRLLYGADSEAALFEGPPGTLNLADLASSSQRPALELTVDLPSCTGICSGRFAFKPQGPN